MNISHYFDVFQRTKRKIPINKGFQLLGYFKIPQFPYPIAEVGLENLRQNGARVNEGLKDSIPFLN